MRILELCTSPALGGLELYVYRCTMQLSSTQSVIAVTSKQSELNKKFSEQNIPVIEISTMFKPLPLLASRQLAKIIDSEQIDVVHTHWGDDFPLAALARKMSHRKPLLAYTRQMLITRSKKDLYHSFLYREMGLMLAITKSLANDCIRMIGSKYQDTIKTLYYGVRKPDKFLTQDEISQKRGELGFSNSDFVVGLFGRLEESKGQHLLIEALSSAKQHNRIIKALIVGHEMNPGYRNKLSSLATSMGIGKNIIFLNFVNNPQRLMQVCDCVALTTYEETFGLVLPEAMRAGVSVIGSNRGGVPEIIEHGKTGLLFESGNADSLAEQLGCLFNDPELVKSLSINGKEKSDTTFSNHKHIQRLVKLFESALSAA